MTSTTRYTPGDLQNYKRRLEQEARLRAQGINAPSFVPQEVRQILESEDTNPIIKGQWPGKYPTRVEELPGHTADLPNWEVEDINQLNDTVRNELFGSWQTSLIPATIKISKILRREEQEKQRQAQIEQARKAGYTVMSEPQSEVIPAAQTRPSAQFLIPEKQPVPAEQGDKDGPHWTEEEFPESETGFHEYWVGPNKICDAVLNCTAEFMLDVHKRFAYPGQDPNDPVVSGEDYMVVDTRTGMEGGMIETIVSEGGYVITNETLGEDEEEDRKEHVFYHGIIERTLYQEDGHWYVKTFGRGNNRNDIYAWINENQGRPIFERVDRAMAYYVFLQE